MSVDGRKIGETEILVRTISIYPIGDRIFDRTMKRRRKRLAVIYYLKFFSDSNYLLPEATTKIELATRWTTARLEKNTDDILPAEYRTSSYTVFIS